MYNILVSVFKKTMLRWGLNIHTLAHKATFNRVHDCLLYFSEWKMLPNLLNHTGNLNFYTVFHKEMNIHIQWLGLKNISFLYLLFLFFYSFFYFFSLCLFILLKSKSAKSIRFQCSLRFYWKTSNSNWNIFNISLLYTQRGNAKTT